MRKPGQKMRAPAIERFDRFWIPEPNTGCWLWIGCLIRTGYGHFRKDSKTLILAHRFSYETHVGPIPEGLDLDHLCRVRSCVNPEHLEPVTRKENVHRSPIWCGNVMQCPQGHPYDVGNTYYECGGKRRCRTCQLAKGAFYYQKRKLKNARSEFACTS